MSQNTSLKMPAIDLDSDGARAQIREAKLRLNTMTWYLYARAIEDFFKQWPDLVSLGVENGGNSARPRAEFRDNEWGGGELVAFSDDEQKGFIEALDRLDAKTFALTDNAIHAPMEAMFCVAYINAEEVMDLFGGLWRSGQEYPNKASEQWTILLAEAGRCRLEGGVDQIVDTQAKPAPRM